MQTGNGRCGKMSRSTIPAMTLALIMAPLARSDTSLEFHDDYYLGFSQGVYYGLMLGGVDYDTAWCVRGELDHVSRELGAGGEFQETLDATLANCRGDGREE
jgi:hypothetical protein